MKICVLAHTFPLSANDSTAAFMNPLVEGIKEQRNSVFVLLPFTEKLRKESFPYPIFTYKYIYPDSFHTLGFGRSLKDGNVLTRESYFLSIFLLFFGTVALYKLCKKQKIDVISAHWVLPNGLIAFIVSKILHIPYTVSLPGSDVYIAKKNKIFASIANVVINNASAVISDSPTYINKAKENNPKPFSYSIIPYPVNIKAIKINNAVGKKLKNRLLIAKNKIVILCVARLIRKKGVKYFINAVHELVKSDKNVTGIIVGDGDLRQELELHVEHLHMKDNIIFAGNINRNQLLAYYNMANIFVASSIKDEFGNVDDQPVSLIEAMACGKPAIATNFPGISLTIKHNKRGFLVKEKDYKKIAFYLHSLIHNKNLGEKMGQEAKKYIIENYSYKIIGEKYNAIFKKLFLISYE